MKTIKNQKLKIMKKLKVFAVLGILMFGMSSCVYSLFPIYTQDTLVFLPELVGKWQDPEESDNYIEFVQSNVKDEGLKVTGTDASFKMNDDSDGKPETYNYTMAGDGWSIKSDDPISVDIDGEEVTDPVRVRAHYDKIFGSMQTEASEGASKMVNDNIVQKIDSATKNGQNLGEDLDKLAKSLNKLGNSLKKWDLDFKGTTYVSTEESYKMIVVEGEERTAYQAHLAQIGEDYFLDIYPLPEYTNDVFDGNMFPVHTFFKLSVDEEEMRMTMFDLEKLNELFESNLIRLRHEYVNGNVLITAQPKEIQKFLDKYSDDENVFDGEAIYSKID